MNRKISYYFFVISFFLGCSSSKPPILYSPPSVLPNTIPAMKTAGFWIGHHSAPDKIILFPEEIKALNGQIQNELKLTKDLKEWPQTYSKEELKTSLSKSLDDLRAQKLMFVDGSLPMEKYWLDAQANFDLGTIAQQIPRQYGLIVRFADQRFLPTEEGLYSKAFDIDFDELQNSDLDIGTPVVVLHRSLDKQWVYVESSISSGWVKSEYVAIANEEQVQKFFTESFVVVTEPKADIYFNSAMTNFYAYVRMGVRLPLIQKNDKFVEVQIPLRNSDGTVQLVSGIVAVDQVHEGYLPYSPRHVLLQAFKMLNQPYGWGGMYGEQDCSRFLQEVFATVGIQLPRDSKNQIKVGQLLASWEAGANNDDKLQALQKKGLAGAAILGMKGHIMLFAGFIDGKPYAIHSVWAYRQPSRKKQDDVYVLNRVVLSDLTLGKGSKRGSLLDRLNAVRMLGK